MDQPPVTDQRTVLLVVKFLGAIALVGLVGLIALVALDRDPAAIAVVGTLTGGAAGSLGTLLASTRSVDVQGLNELAGENPQPVENPVDGEVPVVEAPALVVPDAPDDGEGGEPEA